jgi:hypothetical protein
VQGRLNAFLDTSLPGVVDHGGRNCQGFHDRRVLTARRRFQQNPRSCLLARRTLPLAQQGFQQLNLIIRQRDSILDGRHGSLLRVGDTTLPAASVPTIRSIHGD